MSRRRKRRGARDGYINLPARLGGASTLLSAGTYERTFPFNPALLTSLYRESWIAKRIIDMPGEDMTRGWYTLPLEEKQMEELRALESRHDIRREITDGIADRQGRSFQRLNELYAATGQVGFRATQRVDGRLVLAEAMKCLAVKA